MSQVQTGADIVAAEAGGPLGFEAWVDLSARLMGLDPEARLDILDEAGVDVDIWTRSEQHYALALAEDVAHGRMERATQYAGRCAAEMERRRAAVAAAMQTNGVALEEPHAEEAGAGAPLKIGAPLEEGPVEAPSFLHAPPAPPAPELSPPGDQATTVAAFELPTALRGGALPFKPSATPSLPTSLAAAPLPPQVLSEPSGPEGTMVLGGTAPLDPAMVAKAVLPFGAGAAPPLVARAAPKPVTYPRMPLPTYASLSAELTTYPQHTPEIRKRYGIADDDVQAALDDAWRARLEASTEVRAEWEALVKKHRERLLGQPK